eukprot:TRINITY_DN27764_c0_g1_i1.p1 TRINITY_DN27764_c0_g1~~TRINITY_DN27764_c0_g1_i1.p1  ORF type:complete len:444 (-),score=45.57 TRINITY_DN27764_c0_g1_i1:204-1535(-)
MLGLVLVTLVLAQSHVHAFIPASMLGTWSGNMTQSVFGPLSENTPRPDPTMPFPRVGTVEISSPDASDNFFMRQLWGNQLFRIQHGLMQYCFDNDQEMYRKEAPFMLESNSSDEVKFCWRGTRLPTHKANCTGCDCAQWNLKIDSAGVLHSVFMMSPPAVHLRMDLVRRGPPPPPEQVASGWTCRFDNHTGVPPQQRHQQLRMHSRALLQPRDRFAAAARNSSQLAHCVTLNLHHRARLEYVASTIPCMPCDVNFSISAKTLQNQYVAIGFKGLASEYKEEVPDQPDYWGMSTSDAAIGYQTPLGGRIVLGYSSNTSQACVGEMRANAFVGSVTHVPSDGVIRNLAVTRAGGDTKVKFTVSMNAGTSAEDLDWRGTGFGMRRVMWAIGDVPQGGCQAQPVYHGAARGLAHLNFPYGYSSCDEPDGLDTETAASMLNSDIAVIV